MRTLYPDSWQDYELLDSGNFEKLERFGPHRLIRPEPQALWPKRLVEAEWQKLSSARFVREQKDKHRFVDEAKGGWKMKPKVPDTWQLAYKHDDLSLKLRLALTGFGHVGMFPEQAVNWAFIHETLKAPRTEPASVLNLFAYTGAASVVARMSGAEVVHVDSSRPALNWANQNMQLNGLRDIHWVHEDAIKFVRREVKRGSRYSGVMMDPPPYGRGPKGEKWQLEDQLNELVQGASRLLEGNGSFFILNLYASGLSATVGYNIVTSHFEEAKPEYGELALRSAQGRDLPMGTVVRFRR